MSTIELSSIRDEDDGDGVGLTDTQVIQLKEKWGKNELRDVKDSFWRRLIKHFTHPIAILLFLAIAITAIFGNYIDVGVLVFLFVLNTTVHLFHEGKARSIVAELKKTLALHATVRRNGVVMEIKAVDLVPDDLCFVSVGDVVPADMKMIHDDDFLLVDQSLITGESFPVEKHFGDLLWSSSPVKRGEAWCRVVATGMHTNVGKTAGVVSMTKVSRRYARVLSSINKFILFFDFLFCFIILTIGFVRFVPLLENIELVVMLTVASLPLALPAVLTITMAVGARELAREGAIVTRLSSIEALSSVDVLCTDKTGTLTVNKLTVHRPWVAEGVNEEELMLCAGLCSEHSGSGLDAIDTAILDSLEKYNVTSLDLESFTCIYFSPFDPVSKRVSVVVRRRTGESNEGVGGVEEWKIVKGAPHVIADLVDDDDLEAYERVVDEFAGKGYRSLGVAREIVGVGGVGMKILGIVPLLDPPRSDSAEMIKAAQELGLSVRMLTGDALAIAKETARRLGMGQNIVSAKGFGGGDVRGADIGDADGFSEVFPQHKYQIVDLLQKRGHVVAVSGDGQNDASALKKADVGIAVKGAVDSARAAASIVFMVDGLFPIVHAIRLSRQVFVRMYGYAVYRIAHSMHLLWVVLLLFSIFSLSFPTQLLIILAIFSDLSVLLLGFDNAPSSGVPERWRLGEVFTISIVLSLVLTLGTMIWYIILVGVGLPFGQVISLLFLQVALTENQLIFSTRLRKSAFHKPLPSWTLLLTVVIVNVFATLFVGFGWLSLEEAPWIWILQTWIYSLGVFIVLDALKMTVRSVFTWCRRGEYSPSRALV